MDVKSLPLFKHPERFLKDHDASGHGRKLGLNGLKPAAQPQISDVFEKTQAAKEQTAVVNGSPEGESPEKSLGQEEKVEAGGLNISFQFDLFYELSQKVSAKMGQRGLTRFTEVASQVTETFKGSFSLSIDPVGSFMKGTDAALNISPETTNKFLDSVEGLADLSPTALENFLRESDRFFSELEKTYGSADGAFDGIRDQIQGQATQFFADVKSAQESMLAGGPQALPEGAPLSEAAGTPAATTLEKASDLIPLAFGTGGEVTQEQYQDFLKGFQDYVNRFREQMLKDFLSSSLSAKDHLNTRKPVAEKEPVEEPAKLSEPEPVKPSQPGDETPATPASTLPGNIEFKA